LKLKNEQNITLVAGRCQNRHFSFISCLPLADLCIAIYYGIPGRVILCNGAP